MKNLTSFFTIHNKIFRAFCFAGHGDLSVGLFQRSNFLKFEDVYKYVA